VEARDMGRSSAMRSWGTGVRRSRGHPERGRPRDRHGRCAAGQPAPDRLELWAAT
jgi:hypothetical protein